MAFFGQKSPILNFLVKIFKNKALNKNKKNATPRVLS